MTTRIGTGRAERLVGTVRADRLNGSAGDDVLTGLAGDDVLQGEAGRDVLDGGLGRDTASYQDAPRPVRVDLALATPQATSHGRDRLIGIENLLGSRFGDLLTGDADKPLS